MRKGNHGGLIWFPGCQSDLPGAASPSHMSVSVLSLLHPQVHSARLHGERESDGPSPLCTRASRLCFAVAQLSLLQAKAVAPGKLLGSSPDRPAGSPRHHHSALGSWPSSCRALGDSQAAWVPPSAPLGVALSPLPSDRLPSPAAGGSALCRPVSPRALTCLEALAAVGCKGWQQ